MSAWLFLRLPLYSSKNIPFLIAAGCASGFDTNRLRVRVAAAVAPFIDPQSIGTKPLPPRRSPRHYALLLRSISIAQVIVDSSCWKVIYLDIRWTSTEIETNEASNYTLYKCDSRTRAWLMCKICEIAGVMPYESSGAWVLKWFRLKHCIYITSFTEV